MITQRELRNFAEAYGLMEKLGLTLEQRLLDGEAVEPGKWSTELTYGACKEDIDESWAKHESRSCPGYTSGSLHIFLSQGRTKAKVAA